jgi:hypothetical protein
MKLNGKSRVKDETEMKSLPMRGTVLLFLSLNLLISTITALDFLSNCKNYHPWFVPVFLSAIGLLICIICFYIWQLPRTQEHVTPPTQYQVFLIWLLLVLSVICTSALHKFYPFRPAVLTFWPRIPDHLHLLKYNYILTAVSLLATLILAVLYAFGRSFQAVTGLVILAVVMLVPNDNCGNFFNQSWIKWIGASPLMFMPNSVVLLIGYYSLHGIRPWVSILMIAVINLCVFLLGLGHVTGVVW